MENLAAYLPLLLQGLRMTLLLAVSTLVVGLALGMLLALAKLSRHAWLSRPVYAVTNFLRGIPEFLILLVIYFGGTQVLGPLRHRGQPVRRRPDRAVAGLRLLRLRDLPRRLPVGAEGPDRGRPRLRLLPRWQCFRLIELPQIWKVAIPGLGNLWQGAVKDTALVSIVGLDDLMRKSNQAAQATREPFTFYFVASLMFLAITLVSMAVLAWLERRASRGVPGR